MIDKEWDNNNLYSYINDAIKIENHINNITKINENINKCNKNNKIKIEFSPKEDSFKDFLKSINSFGKIYLKNFSFKECPKNINDKRAYSISGENNNILTKTGTNGCWMGTICENELDKSIEEHKWKIKLLNVKYNHFMVGVAPIDFDINSSSYNNCGWYLFCNNSTLYSGPPFNYSGKNTNLSKVNDEIIVVMNLKKRTLMIIEHILYLVKIIIL